MKKVGMKKFKEYLEKSTPCIIVTRGLEIFESLEKYARIYGRTILRTNEDTTGIISRLKRYLDEKLAKRDSCPWCFS